MDINLLNKNSYVTFDAFSLRDLIIDRLNRGKVFTDQNYQGSNLSAFIDIISYTFSTLLYYLNKTSSESMFSEAQLYENLNRIVKILNYNPIGRMGQNVPFTITAPEGLEPGNYTIPRYSYISVGGTVYSMNQDITFTKSTTAAQVIDNIANSYLAYQGIYQEYPIYTAAGIDNEILFLGLSDEIYADHFNIDVYVKQDGTNKWQKWNRATELFLYSAEDEVYEIRFNENKRYEIKFGDNINGKALNQNDKVLVYYLKIDKDKQSIGVNGMANTNIISYNTINYKNILLDTSSIYENYLTTTQLKSISLNNDYPSTVFSDYENVDSIRKNAPKTFRSQYRLITDTDFESYLISNYGMFLSDVKVVNNEDFLKNYVKYYYDIGLKDPQKENRILFNQIKFSSSCNFNNLYAYMVPKNNIQEYITPPQKEIILNGVNSSKIMTSNFIPMDPVYIYIDFYLQNINETVSIDKNELTRIKITKSLTSRRSDSAIKADIQKIFKTYFDRSVNKLGQLIDIYQLSTDILNIDSVDRIQTYRTDIDLDIEGLSLIFWNSLYPESDAKVHSQNIQLENFKYPIFQNLENLFSRIDIIEKTGSIKAADF
jgi:hypothetical protein